MPEIVRKSITVQDSEIRGGKRDFAARNMRLGVQMIDGDIMAQKARDELNEGGKDISPQRRKELLEQIAQGQRQRTIARDQLVEGNMGLVFRISEHFSHKKIEDVDLIQYGTVGLIEAANKYDYTKGEFGHFAFRTIEGHLKHALRENHTLSVPHRITDAYSKVAREAAALTQELRRKPTDEELAQALDKSSQETEEILDAMRAEESVIYYHADVNDYDAQEAYKFPDSSVNVEEEVATKVTIHGLLSPQNEELDDQSKKVLIHRFYNELSQRQVAELLGISQMHVSRLERKALATMRGLLNPHGEE